MKNKLAILIITALIICGYFIWSVFIQITPNNLNQIHIEELGTKAEQTYKLESAEAKNLLNSFNGLLHSKLPEASLKTFELTLQNNWGFKKKYNVYFDIDKKEVYTQDLGTDKIMKVGTPSFFTSFKGFDSIYPYGIGPKVQWTSSISSFNVCQTNKKWAFKKWDENWYETLEEVSPANQTNKVISSEVDIAFKSDYTPNNVFLEVRDRENQIISKKEIKDFSIPIIKADGSYKYKVEINWLEQGQPYKGSYAFEFDLNVDLPVSFEIPKHTLTQGEVVEIRVHNVNENEKPILKQSLFEHFQFYKNKSSSEYIGYIPTGYFISPGKYEFEYGVEGAQTTKKTLTVKPRNFFIQHLFVDKNIEASTRNDDAYAEYDKYFVPARLSSSETVYYSDSFVIPAKGRLSTEFGETRHVNGSPTSYRHSGLDIAAPTGTPVYATNRGKVMLSMYLKLTGNTIVIDHGQGLFSVYFHLNELFAKQGSIAERGQRIATVGTTGFSTGPHLHFTMSYYDVNIEPGYLLVGEAITNSNYKSYLSD